VTPQAQQAAWEAQARTLKEMGYNGSVVARKLIDEHDMPEDAATALVGRLYQKKVDPRAGETLGAVLQGAGIASIGLIGTIVLGVGFVSVPYPFWVAGFGFIGAGLTRVIIALVNANAKDDLRTRRD